MVENAERLQSFLLRAHPVPRVTIAGGVAKMTTTKLTSGSHTITATYAGNADFDTSTSSPLTQTVN